MKRYILTKLAGRLGNQMFEYAFARSLSLQLGHSLFFSKGEEETRLDCFALPEDTIFDIELDHFPLYHRLGYRFYETFVRDRNNPESNYKNEIKYSHFLNFLGIHICRDGYIAPDINLLRHKNIYSIGYFQSEQYFKDYNEIIKRDFCFKESVKEKCELLASEIKSTSSVCVHVRLGDYLRMKQFMVCTPEYYHNAISYLRAMISNPHFYIFTDSPELIGQYLNMKDCYVVPNAYIDSEALYLGSLCKHHIISNSSFSWWMQYLGAHEDQIVVAPSRWFNNEMPSFLYQNHWTIFNV